MTMTKADQKSIYLKKSQYKQIAKLFSFENNVAKKIEKYQDKIKLLII